MATPARKVKSTNVDGQSTSYLSPAEQRQEDTREQESKITAGSGKAKNFFRVSRLYSRDNGGR